eukprot:UN30516
MVGSFGATKMSVVRDGQWGLSIISRYKILQYKEVILRPVTCCCGCGCWPGCCHCCKASGKKMLAAEIEIPRKKREPAGKVDILWVINVHLKVDLTGYIQKQEVDDILRFIEKNINFKRNPGANVVICGDFNSLTCFGSVQKLGQ